MVNRRKYLDEARKTKLNQVNQHNEDIDIKVYEPRNRNKEGDRNDAVKGRVNNLDLKDLENYDVSGEESEDLNDAPGSRFNKRKSL